MQFVVIYAFFVENFILQEFCLCKKMTNMRYVLRVAKGEEPGQPGAGDMRELVWDEELEAIAQR